MATMLKVAKQLKVTQLMRLKLTTKAEQKACLKLIEL